MRAYELHGTNGIDSVTKTDRDVPEPGPGQVQIKVHAVSLNYRDHLIANGAYGSGIKSNVIPCSDGAGEVTAVGEGVTSIAVGDRVTGAFFPNWISGNISAEAVSTALGGTVDGMLAESVVLPAQAALPFPEHLSFEEAATLPCAALTAWQALVHTANVRAGETVLLQGTGGVSIFALQFAKLFGAVTIQTSSSNEKLARTKELGADHLVNYRTTPEWQEEALKLTSGRGVDTIIEVGGAGTLERSLQAIRVGGTVATIGLVAGVGQINPLPLITRSIKLDGVYVGSHAMFAEMNRAITAHKLRPIIDRTFPFDQATEAFRYQESGSHFGKVVIAI